MSIQPVLSIYGVAQMAPSNVPTLSGCPTVSPALLAIFKGCRRPKAAGLSTNSSVEIVQASRFFLGKSTFWGKFRRGGARVSTTLPAISVF